MIEHIKPYVTIKEAQAVAEYVGSGGYLTEYKYTKQFEQILAKFLGVKYVSMTPSGFSALYLSLLACDIGQGDEVIVPAHTMIAVPNAVVMTGATPVLVDVDKDTHCINMDNVKVTKKTKAMIYVDANGKSGDMEEIQSFCEKNKITLIEDACQAFGSAHNGKYLGTFGRYGCFSLGFHKIITTGQGGFITANSKKDHEIIERLKDYGRIAGGNDKHDHLGYNFKYTDVQAVIGIEQIKSIAWRMQRKREIYKEYHGEEAPEGYVPWFIEYKTRSRNVLINKLKDKGIASRKMYPPIHKQKIYPNGKYPISDILGERGIWVPSSLGLTSQDITNVKEIVYAHIQRH